jgi:hypothetical protein
VKSVISLRCPSRPLSSDSCGSYPQTESFSVTAILLLELAADNICLYSADFQFSLMSNVGCGLVGYDVLWCRWIPQCAHTNHRWFKRTMMSHKWAESSWMCRNTPMFLVLAVSVLH